jgi:hypothetical protein
VGWEQDGHCELIRPGGREFLGRGRMGRVFMKASWWEMDPQQWPLEGLQAHFGSSQKGGSFFSKLQPTVLGEHREHFIIDYSLYYCYYITIFIKPPPTKTWGAK